MRRTSRRRSVSGVLVALVVASGIAGCDDGREDEVPPSPNPTVDVEPPAETPVEPAGAIPSDCRNLLQTAEYDTVFGGIPLNDPAFGVPSSGVVEPVQPDVSAGPKGAVIAATRLWCVWADPRADISGLTARFGQVDPASVQPFFDALPAEGYTCIDEYDGRMCQRIRANDQYGVEEGSTYFIRDDIVISVDQANFLTDDLLADFVDAIWA